MKKRNRVKSAESRPESRPEESPEQGGRKRFLSQIKWPLVIYLAAFAVFALVSSDRVLTKSRDNHYVYLAEGMLHGRLHLEGNPPHLNDWARYDGKWYVSFPPAPGVLMIPGVALFGLDFNDRAFTLVFAAAGPALLFLLLWMLAQSGRIDRRPWEMAVLAGVYGVGTVYFFSAVQGSVWYTAHMVGSAFLLLFAICSLGGRHPFWAGLCLGVAYACRPTLLFAFPFFLGELLIANAPPDAAGLWNFLSKAARRAGIGLLARRILLFGLPIAAVAAALIWMNWVRFGDPFEFGHKYLQVRWAGRIARWGLFNYHYLARNLAVSLALLPWITDEAPYIGISTHGLALWFTTPLFFWVLWPKTATPFYRLLALTAICAALPSLFYQNSGWVQFGYRFSLDYTVFLMVMLAAGQRKMGKLFFALCLFSVAVNLFGAITFDRNWEYYPSISTGSYFQPD